MSSHQRFKFKDKEALLTKIEELGVDIPFADDIEILFEGIKIGDKTVPNRFVVHPMEGFDSSPDGTPQELAFRRYKRYALGGSGIIWFEATAIVHQARSNPRQLFITNNNVGVFEKLVKETRRTANNAFGSSHNPLLILQLTHSGRYSKPNGKPQPIIAHHNEILDPLCKLPGDFPLITDNDLDGLQETYVSAARLAANAGFDGVDIKACHGYLVSELLAAFTRKESKYGGNFENRIRFLLETAIKIKKNVAGLFVTSRLNAYDAIPYPFGFGVNKTDPSKPDLTEPKFLLKELITIGIPILNISIGNPYYHPEYGRPYDLAVMGTKVADEHPLAGVARLIRITSELQGEFPELPIVGTGYSWLRHFFPNVAAAVVKSGKASLIGQGRGAFAYPDYVKDLAEKGAMDPRKVCVACSRCSQLMRDNCRTGCVNHDKEIYGAEYRRSRSKVHGKS